MARVKLFFGKKSAPKPVDTVNTALRGGVAVNRFRLTPEQVAEIKKAERQGPEAGLACVLRILAQPKT